MVFAYVCAKDIKACGCPKSVVLKFVLEKMFLEHELHELGMHLHCDGVKIHKCITFGCFLGDDEALMQFASAKGPSAGAPCPKCFNVKGRCEPESLAADPFYVHFKPMCTRIHAYRCVMCPRIHAHRCANRIAEAENLEKKYGIRYEPWGIAFDRRFQAFACIPRCLYFDWQHMKEGKHVKAFASECITCVQVHVQKLKVLKETLDMLRPFAAKQRMHYQRHITDSIHEFQEVDNCFPTERRHKTAKQWLLTPTEIWYA